MMMKKLLILKAGRFLLTLTQSLQVTLSSFSTLPTDPLERLVQILGQNQKNASPRYIISESVLSPLLKTSVKTLQLM